jgi:ribonuclease R
MLTIRAQAKAVYSTYNIGHYGLAFSHYTHFTSPIRRYPDLMVHRLVEKYILTGKKISLTREELEMMCEHCSTCEQDAAQAERDSVKMFQALWLEDHIGETYTGYVSNVTDFGIFVQLDANHCEGLIHKSKIGDLDKYLLGDTLTVKVTKVDPDRGYIDFDLA